MRSRNFNEFKAGFEEMASKRRFWTKSRLLASSSKPLALSCNNSKNKLCVFQNNGVDILIRRAINCDDVNTLDPVLCCLRNLSCRHPEAYNAALTFRSHYWGVGVKFFERILGLGPE